MKPLTIEINGTGTLNRGAELMAIAAAQTIRTKFPEARLVVPRDFGSSRIRRRYGFVTTREHFGGGRGRLLCQFIPASFWRTMGVIDPGDVDAVLDASGFAFSDQWGADLAKRLLAKMNAPDRSHQPLVLLPQALGPFDTREVSDATKALFARANLVCARDKKSFEEASRICDPAKLRQYPDFTISVEPSNCRSLGLPPEFSAVVPNLRMMDKRGSSKDYLFFLEHVISGLSKRGMNPVFLLHDAVEDVSVIDKINQSGISIPVFTDRDPRVLKAILRAATVVVGSRFHALVSSLCQGVPCLGAGWSHKYVELFTDYGCPELLCKNLGDERLIDGLLDAVSDAKTRHQFRQTIEQAASGVREKTSAMWNEVTDVISESCILSHS